MFSACGPKQTTSQWVVRAVDPLAVDEPAGVRPGGHHAECPWPSEGTTAESDCHDVVVLTATEDDELLVGSRH
jgi:hypothetical protein